MHPDKKVGLALGILLIGITGAFFFRNEAPSDESPTGQLTTAESLDRRIDRSGTSPYAAADLSEDRPSLSDVPEVAASDIVPQIPDADAFAQSEPLPEPLRADGASDILAPLPRLDEVTDFSPNTVRAASSGHSLTSAAPTGRGSLPPSAEVASTLAGGATANAAKPAASQPAQRIHEVVAGDNLSTLAQQYLGSQSKYLKLYEANRDVLKSPDDLRVGMRLKIPATNAQNRSPAKSAAATDSPAERSATSETPRLSKKPKGPAFVKPEKSPIVPHGRQANQTGKSVSQTPPPDLPKVEGLLPESKPAVIASRPDDER